MAHPVQSGRFITLEGGEGAGKSTQAEMLANALRQHGIEVLLTREPGGTVGAESIRKLLLSPPGDTAWNAEAEALLFAAARADHVDRKILPALAKGHWVICDRFLDSSRAYQGGGGGLADEDLLTLHRIGSSGLLPDLTILLEVIPTNASERLVARDGSTNDAISGKGAEYHSAVAQRFRQLMKDEPHRFACVDGNGDEAEVHARIMKVVGSLLEGEDQSPR